jgi:hypothetical protein
MRPGGHLDLDRRIDFAAVCFGMLLQVIAAEIRV